CGPPQAGPESAAGALSEAAEAMMNGDSMENSAFWRRRGPRLGACAVAASLAFALPGIAGAAQAGPAAPVAVPAPLEQDLGRGVVAATTDDGAFISWRLRGSETTGHTDEGMTGADFALYRDGAKIATVTDSTNYLDAGGSAASEYAVAAVVNGVELERSPAVTPWGGQYASIPLQKPEGGRMPPGVLHPEGELYTYSANDMSVADVD